MSVLVENMSENVKTEDSLSDLLRKVSFGATVFFRSEYCGHWAIDTSGSRQVPFHLVSQGEGWLHSGAKTPERLLAGHLVLFPNDSPHLLTATMARPDKEVINRGPPARMEGPVTRLICGYFLFDQRAAAPLLSSLPATMVLDLTDTPNSTVRELAHLWMQEAKERQLGSDIAIDRLAELVFIHMLRSEIAAGRITGLIGALADARLGPILADIHRVPGAAHRLEYMAAASNLSESAFAQRFKKQVGMTPGNYVRHWRMQTAARALRETERSMANIANSIGYNSEVAFRKAFRAFFDMAPGHYRRNSRSKTDAEFPLYGKSDQRRSRHSQ